MKLSLIFILAILVFLSAKVLAQGPGDLNAGSQLSVSGSTGAYTFSWWGEAGCTYLIKTSDDLINWSYLPIVETGSNAVIQWGFTSNSDKFFLKLEYITLPASQISGTTWNGQIDPSSGLPEDWELFYYGTLSVNPNAAVDWSNGTVTNLQAYQRGLNPLDFYKGVPPTLSQISSTLGSILGESDTLTVLVFDSNHNPMPGAPIIFSIDHGLLEAPGSSASSQTLQVAADANGIATATVIMPLWPGVSVTVTETALSGGQPTTTQCYGETGGPSSGNPASMPPVNQPTLVQEPTLAVQLPSGSETNPAYPQFTNTPPINHYHVSTVTSNASSGQYDYDYEYPPAYFINSGTCNTVSTFVTAVSGNTWNPTFTYTGTSTQ